MRFSPMHAWRGRLTGEEMMHVIQYVRAWRPPCRTCDCRRRHDLLWDPLLACVAMEMIANDSSVST